MKNEIKIHAVVKSYGEAKELLTELEVLKDNFLVTVEISVQNGKSKSMAIDLPGLQNQ